MGYPNVAYFATLLAFNAPQGGVLLRTMSIKFCTEVKGWLRYKTASSARTLQTTDSTTDGFAIAKTRT